jgi:hypothetical protein
MSSYTHQFEFEVDGIYYIVLALGNTNKLFSPELVNVIYDLSFGPLQKVWGKQLFYDQTINLTSRF